MNEIEELALASLGKGGPEEVLTEQANNDPEVPSVEPLPIPEEKKNETPVDVKPVDVSEPPKEIESQETVIQTADTPFSANSNMSVDNLQFGEELENPYLDDNFGVNEFGGILTGDESPDNVNLARNLGFSNVKRMVD